MNEKKPLDVKNIKSQGLNLLAIVTRYKLVVFLVFVAILYGFLWLRISSFSSAQPSTTEVSSQVQAAQIPHIDKTVVQQLQGLQDNSVSVKSLFDQARSNPFQ
jgi:hypothetical protein